MKKKSISTVAYVMLSACSVAFGHAGPRIYLDIESGKVMTYDGPYPPPEDSSGNVITDPSAYTHYAPSNVFPGLPPNETTTNGQPDAGVLPSHWDDSPSNFTTQFPGLQAYPPGLLPAGTSFSYNIMGEVLWYIPASSSTPGYFEPISKAFPMHTPFMAVTTDQGLTQFTSTGFVAGDLAFTYSGDPTDHQHLTFTICTPEDLADGFSPEDAPAGIYALPLQFTSPSATTPTSTVYLLFGDRGPDLSISQIAMQNEMLQAITQANAGYLRAPASLTWIGNLSGGLWDINTTTNWNNTTAPANPDRYLDGDTVLFDDTAANKSVTLNTSVAPASVTVSASGNYAITGTGSIGGTGALTKSGSGALTIATANTYSGGTNVNGGTLIVANATALGSGALAVHTGAVVRFEAGLPAGVSISGVSFDGSAGNWSGSLDIANDKLVVEATPDTKASALAALENQTLYGRTHSSGITSSTLTSTEGIAVVDNAVLNLSNFGGVEVDADSILVTPAILGDANLNGTVSLTDLSIVLNNFGQNTTAWSSGNFDGASSIDLTDLSDVLNNFGQSYSAVGSGIASGGLNTSNAGTAAPEPLSLSILGFGALGLLRRRRRWLGCTR